ncbi:MAG TPA: condensation domain-containing protein, partial [Candidatus Angelobacter sp.]|nr:condensation domain-containing protein [Candidatus Angelobacter sp.]
MIEQHAESFIDILTFRAAATPDKIIYRFLERGETESGSLSYEQLRKKSQAIAAQLQALNAGNKRALLLYEPGLDYIAGFYGCLYAGVVAVPAYPPKRYRSDARLLQLFADAKPEFILTSSRMKVELEQYLAEMRMPNRVICLSTDDLPEARAGEWRRPPLTRNSIAFLQYSSGSTSSPRGVVISHGNLLHNSSLLRDAFDYSPESVCVSWLPVFHDMGLIGSVLQPIHGDFPCIFMSPMSFLESPYRWLNAISKYRARLSGAPNFAYELCARSIGEQRNNLDLSSWEVAFNGAEPVRSATLQRFAAAFAPCGFRPAAFLTCYGLAEATLIVSGKKQHSLPQHVAISKTELSQNRVVESATDNKDAQILTGCGMPAAGQKVIIVDPETHLPCGEYEVGEIWVSGASVASGYWNKNEETQQTFRAYLANSHDGPYLRTGDLGFLRRGELVVTGRLKDLIILRGRNYYPQDIEATAESSHSLLRRGSVAAFAVDSDEQERLVILQEARRQCSSDDLPQMITAIRRAVAENHGLIPHTVAILAEGSVLKTSSGKIRRYACREAFLKGKLKVLAINKREEELEIRAENIQSAQKVFREQVTRQIEVAAQAEIARILGIPIAEIDANDSLARLGIDSLGAVQLARSLERHTGLSLPLSDILQPLSLRELASQLAAQLQHGPQQSSKTPRQVISAPTRTDEPIPLSYGQEQLWLIQKLHPDNCAYNEGYVVSISGELNTDALMKSFREVIRRHQVLRTVFRSTESGPRQFVLTDGDFEMPVLDLPSGEAEEQASSLVKEVCRQIFNLEAGPLLRARLLRFSQQNHLLVVVLHHIVCDGLSMEVLKNELGALYGAYKHNGSSPLAALPIQYGDYACWQRQRLAGEVLDDHLQYWRKQLAGMAALELSADYPRPAAFTYRGAVEAIELENELQTLLKGFSRQEGVTLFATLLSTFQVLLARYTQQWDIPVGSPAANRRLSETEGLIGLFMNPLVLRARFDPHKSFREALHEVRKITLEAFAHQELPFQLLVQDLDPNRNLAANPLFQVLFALQSGIGRDLRLEGLQVAPRPVHNGTAKFDLSLYLEEATERLNVRVEYSSDLFSAERIKRMLRHWQRLMEAAIATPERRISELPLMPPEEERQLLLDWNNTGLKYD